MLLLVSHHDPDTCKSGITFRLLCNSKPIPRGVQFLEARAVIRDNNQVTLKSSKRIKIAFSWPERAAMMTCNHDSRRDCFPVHCRAGLVCTGTLSGVWMMKHAGFGADDATCWIGKIMLPTFMLFSCIASPVVMFHHPISVLVAGVWIPLTTEIGVLKLLKQQRLQGL